MNLFDWVNCIDLVAVITIVAVLFGLSVSRRDNQDRSEMLEILRVMLRRRPRDASTTFEE
jgi:hypothetical protein